MAPVLAIAGMVASVCRESYGKPPASNPCTACRLYRDSRSARNIFSYRKRNGTYDLPVAKERRLYCRCDGIKLHDRHSDSTDNIAVSSVMVSNVAGTASSSAASLTANVPPSITTQPISQVVAAGQSVTFSVAGVGTPPLDRTRGPNGVIYLVSMTLDGLGNHFQTLHALDIATGAELFGGPTTIQESYPGNGFYSSGGQVVFDPTYYKERTALLLLNGQIYTAWASHCDAVPYTGWIISFDAQSLNMTSVLNVTPHGGEGATDQTEFLYQGE